MHQKWWVPVKLLDEINVFEMMNTCCCLLPCGLTLGPYQSTLRATWPTARRHCWTAPGISFHGGLMNSPSEGWDRRSKARGRRAKAELERLAGDWPWFAIRTCFFSRNFVWMLVWCSVLVCLYFVLKNLVINQEHAYQWVVGFSTISFVCNLHHFSGLQPSASAKIILRSLGFKFQTLWGTTHRPWFGHWFYHTKRSRSTRLPRFLVKTLWGTKFHSWRNSARWWTLLKSRTRQFQFEPVQPIATRSNPKKHHPTAFKNRKKQTKKHEETKGE